MMGMAWLLFRRSIAPFALIATLGLMLASFFLRPLEPLIEMTWAIYNFNFGTVLLAPILGGLAAWDGVRLSSARGIFVARGHALRSVVAHWAMGVLSVAVSYAVGAGLVAFAAHNSGTPAFPGALQAWTIVPAVGLLSFALAIGYVVGWHTSQPIYVGVVPVIVFSAIIFSYTVNLNFVRVGGATASMVSLRPRLDVGAAQLVFYIGGSVLALSMAAGGRRLSARAGAVAAGLGALALSGAFLLAADGTLETISPDVRCVGDGPELCLSPEYERFRARFVAASGPLVEALDSVSVPKLERLTQNGLDVGVGIGFIPMLRAIDENPEVVVAGAIVNAFTNSCRSRDTEEVWDASSLVVRWVYDAYSAVEQGNAIAIPDEVAEAFRVIAIQCTT